MTPSELFSDGCEAARSEALPRDPRGLTALGTGPLLSMKTEAEVMKAGPLVPRPEKQLLCIQL